MGDGIKSIGNRAFFSCISLKEITLPAGVKSIGDRAFNYDCSLETVNITGNKVKNIGDHAFAYCSGLKQVTLPESVISIGDSAFYESGLQSVNIGASVTNIGSNAFACCKNLREVRYSGTLEMWDNIVKGKNAFQKGVKLTCKGITGGTSTGSNI